MSTFIIRANKMRMENRLTTVVCCDLKVVLEDNGNDTGELGNSKDNRVFFLK